MVLAVVVAGLFIAPLAVAGQASSGDVSSSDGGSTEAIVLDAESVAGRQVVAIGRDLVIEGEALRSVATLNGDAMVAGTVAGDLVVLGGSARLAGSARVQGDVYVLGGRLDAEPGSEIGGRSVAYPDAPSALLLLVEGPTLGLDPLSPTVIGAKAALMLAWTLTGLILVTVWGRSLGATAVEIQSDPLRGFIVGLVAVFSMALSVLFVNAFAPLMVGLPLVLLVVLAALVLKLWGTVAVFCSLGVWLRGRFGWARLDAVATVLLGLVALGLVKMIPYVGVWIWTAVSLVGIGAALTTKLGRHEPWIPSTT